LAGGAFAGVVVGKSGFGGEAGVVEISCNLISCSSVLIGVAGGFELDSPIVEAKLSPNIELPVEAAGFGKSSLADPSPLKVEPSLNPFVGIPKGFGLGTCGVGVASSLSRFDPSVASLKSDTWVEVFEANDELACPKAEPGWAGVLAHDGSVEPVPDRTSTVDPKLEDSFFVLENTDFWCPRPVKDDDVPLALPKLEKEEPTVGAPAPIFPKDDGAPTALENALENGLGAGSAGLPKAEGPLAAAENGFGFWASAEKPVEALAALVKGFAAYDEARLWAFDPHGDWPPPMPPIAPNAGLVAEPTADAAPKAAAHGLSIPVTPAPTGEAVPKADVEGFPKLVTPAPTGEAVPKADTEGFPKLVAPNEFVVVAPNALAGREGCPNPEPDVDDDWLAASEENVGWANLGVVWVEVTTFGAGVVDLGSSLVRAIRPG
jgi:hypothetical protein